VWGLEGGMAGPNYNVFGARTKWRLKAGEQLTLRRRVKFVGGVQWKVYEARLGAEVVRQPTATLAMNLLDRDSNVLHNLFSNSVLTALRHGWELRLGWGPRRRGHLYRVELAGARFTGKTPERAMDELDGGEFHPL